MPGVSYLAPKHHINVLPSKNSMLFTGEMLRWGGVVPVSVVFSRGIFYDVMKKCGNNFATKINGGRTTIDGRYWYGIVKTFWMGGIQRTQNSWIDSKGMGVP